MPQPGQTRRRQEIWEDEYRRNPYLTGKPLPHLVERFRYLDGCEHNRGLGARP